MQLNNGARRSAAAVLSALAVVALAGCGSSSNASDSSSAGAANAAVNIGFASVDTGASPWPGVTEAVNAAVKYVNAELGGLNGHPIHLVTCDTKGEQAASQACGQQFANDSSVPAVIAGMDNSLEALQGSLKGKPLFTGLSLTPTQDVLTNTYSYITGVDGTFAAYAKYMMDNLHAKRVSMIHEDDPSMNAAGKLLNQLLTAGGVTFKEASVPVSASDVTAQVSAMGADKADAVVVMGPSNCNVYADAFASLNIKPKNVLTGSSCLAKPMAESYSKFIGWTMLSPMKLTAGGADSAPDIATMLKAWPKYAGSDKPGTYAELGWSTVLNFANAVNAAKPSKLDAASIGAALKNYKGDGVIGGDGIDCSKAVPSMPVVCRTPQVFGYQLTASGLKLQG